MFLLKNKFLNTSSMLHAMDGEKSAAELEREQIALETLKPDEKEEADDKSGNDDEGSNEAGEENNEEANEEENEEAEEVEETAEAKAIREAAEAADAGNKTKRQVERMQKRIDTLTAKSRTTETENAELKKLLDAKKEDGSLTLTEDEVERRAELKAQEKAGQREFERSVNTLAKNANALDKEFSKNIDTITKDVALLPPVMIGILDDIDVDGKKVGAEVLVYLSKNIDDYEEFFTNQSYANGQPIPISEGRMGIKLQKIADKISKKPAKRVSQVDAPLKAVGAARAQSPLNDTMDDATWIAKREADVKAKRA